MQEIDPAEVLLVARINHLWEANRGIAPKVEFEELSKVHQEKYMDKAWSEFRQSRAETLEMQQRLHINGVN